MFGGYSASRYCLRSLILGWLLAKDSLMGCVVWGKVGVRRQLGIEVLNASTNYVTL